MPSSIAPNSTLIFQNRIVINLQLFAYFHFSLDLISDIVIFSLAAFTETSLRTNSVNDGRGLCQDVILVIAFDNRSKIL